MSKSNFNKENDPSKPMDSKREVENSNDEKTDQDFPGYPHYPAKDDILNQQGMKKLSVDDENFTRSGAFMAKDKKVTQTAESGDEPDDSLGIVPGTDADVTKDDLIALDDKKLPNTGEDLDIPGAELDDDNEAIGEEDEENNYYSLGGDRHEDLETTDS